MWKAAHIICSLQSLMRDVGSLRNCWDVFWNFRERSWIFLFRKTSEKQILSLQAYFVNFPI